MKYCYPLQASQTYTYTHKIRDYRYLSTQDKKVLINNVKEFAKYCFWWLNLPHPTRDQLFIIKELAKATFSREPIMIEAQRGLAKSLGTQIVTVWLLLRDKEEKVAVISATGKRSESWTIFILNLIRLLPLTQHLYPNTSQRSSGTKFDINGCIPSDSPSVSAYGVTSQKTGMRASIIIYDDIEIIENSDTAGKRDKLVTGAMDAMNLGIAGKYRAVCLCTPQSSQTVYNILEERGFKKTVIPAEFPESLDNYQGKVAKHLLWLLKRNPNLVGLNTDKRMDMAHLMAKKLEVGKSQYKLQYMLDTTLSDEDRFPLKLRDLIVMDLDYEQAPVYIEYSSDRKDALYDVKHSGFLGDGFYKPRFISSEKRFAYDGIAMFIDPSGSGSDETAYAVSAVSNGRIFVLSFGGLKGGYDSTTLMQLAEIAKLYKVHFVQIESNFGDGAFAELLKPILRRTHNCKVEDIRATTQKELRIITTLEPIMNQHRLVIDKQALIRDHEKQATEYKLTHQLTHLTKERGSLKHDDIIDVVGMAVEYWKKTMAKDVVDEMQRYEEEMVDKELEEFMEAFGSFKNKNNVMVNYKNKEITKTT